MKMKYITNIKVHLSRVPQKSDWSETPNLCNKRELRVNFWQISEYRCLCISTDSNDITLQNIPSSVSDLIQVFWPRGDRWKEQGCLTRRHWAVSPSNFKTPNLLCFSISNRNIKTYWWLNVCLEICFIRSSIFTLPSK